MIKKYYQWIIPVLITFFALNGIVSAYQKSMLLLGVSWPATAASLVSFKSRYGFGPNFRTTNTFGTASIIDASGEKAAWVFRSPCTAIDEVGFRTGTVTTADDLTVSLQDVDTTTGNPDGTQDQSVSVTLADTDDNVWKETSGLTNRTGMTIGDLVAVVIDVTTFVDANFVIATGVGTGGGTSGVQSNSIYIANFQSAAWTKLTNQMPVLSITCVTNGNVFMPELFPFINFTTQSLNTASNPDEAGLIYQLPFAHTVSGICAEVDGDNPYDIVLYDSDGVAVLGTGSFDPDVRQDGSSNSGCVRFSETAQLSANTNYRAAIKPTTTSAITLVYADVQSANYLGHLAGGTNFHWTHRENAGSWTEITTRRPVIEVIIEDILVP